MTPDQIIARVIEQCGPMTEPPTMTPGELIAAITKLRREVWRHGWRASSGLRAAVESEQARAAGALQ